RFNHVLARYLSENHALDSQLFQALASVSVDGAWTASAVTGLLQRLEQLGCDTKTHPDLALYPAMGLSRALPRESMEWIRKISDSVVRTHASLFFVESRLPLQTVPSILLLIDELGLSTIGPRLGHLLLRRITRHDDKDEVESLVFGIVERLGTENTTLSNGMLVTMLVIHKLFVIPSIAAYVERSARQRGLDWPSMEFEAAIKGFLHSGQIDEADACFQQQDQQKLGLSHDLMNAFVASICSKLRALSSTGDGKKLDEKAKGRLMNMANLYYMRLQETKLHINDETYTAMLETFAASGNHERCLAIIKNMHRRGLLPSALHYSYLVDAYCNCGSVLLAKGAIQDMTRQMIKPNTQIYNRIIRAYLEQTAPNFSKSLKYLEQMLLYNIPMNAETISLFADHLQHQSPQLRRDWFSVLAKSILPLPVDAYNALVQMEVQAQNYHQAREYHELLCSESSPNTQSRLLMLRILCETEDYANALRYFDSEAASLSQEYGSYSLLFALCRSTGNFDALQSWWERFSSLPQATANHEWCAAYESYLDCILSSGSPAEFSRLLQEHVLAHGKVLSEPFLLRLEQLSAPFRNTDLVKVLQDYYPRTVKRMLGVAFPELRCELGAIHEFAVLQHRTETDARSSLVQARAARNGETD
ncbi:hypothetical protein HDU91_007382, partial [Kappamyces sp. JEL0680]